VPSQLHSWNFVTSRTLTWDIFYFIPLLHKNKSTLPHIKTKPVWLILAAPTCTSSLKMDNHVSTVQTRKL
jgi:hypothetical protein